jgi:hypothetical protein
VVCIKSLSAADYLSVAETGRATPDLRVLAFAAGVSLIAGWSCGLIPAVKASRSNFNDALKTGGRDAMGSHHRTRIRSLLVMTEIAFSLVLLCGGRSVYRCPLRLLHSRTKSNPGRSGSGYEERVELRTPIGGIQNGPLRPVDTKSSMDSPKPN